MRRAAVECGRARLGFWVTLPAFFISLAIRPTMSQEAPREQQLLISVLGDDPRSMASELCRLLLEARCSVSSSRLSRHAQAGAMVLQVSGSWDALVRLENNLAPLGKRMGWQVSVLRTPVNAPRSDGLPYVVYANAAYRPDVLNELCHFFALHNIELEAMTCDTYQAPHSSSLLMTATLTVNLPQGIQISWLREQFLDFADSLNLDAIIEPWRPTHG